MVVIRKLTKSSICALIACLAGFLLCASVLRNWSVHARFNLLLNGHLFSELVDPKGLDAELVHNRQHLLVSKLVFSGGEYRGFLDGFGQFIPKDSDRPAEDRLRNGTLIVNSLMFIFGGTFIAGGMTVAWRLMEAGTRSRDQHADQRSGR